MSSPLGYFFAITAGLFNNLGLLLQKKVVNAIPVERREEKFYRTLVKKPLWLLGFAFEMVVGTLFFLLAQVSVGPALIPGLMASGLIVTAIGASALLGEKLKASELAGILLLVVAITLLGYSEFIIDVPGYDYLDTSFQTRAFIFTAALSLLVVAFDVTQRKSQLARGVSLSTESGLLFAISNFWIAPLLGIISHVFTGQFQVTELLVFVFACVVLPVTNLFAVGKMQAGFKHGKGSILIPTQQIPMQLAPIFVYLSVFLLPPPNEYSVTLMLVGVALIVACTFLLAKRQAEFDELT
ncbi:MAG: hypothetical protein Kow0069_11010 [Promethearchaeota archaeon]